MHSAHVCCSPSNESYCAWTSAGYLPERDGLALEFVQKARPQNISIGSGFRHFSVAVPSIEAAISKATERGLGIVEGTWWEKGEVYIRVQSFI
jgi:hypothetical protein